jgi:hypothetical protein
VADQIREGIRTASGPARDANLRQTIAGMVRTEALRAEPLADSMASDSDVSGRAFHELIVTDLGPELPKIVAPPRCSTSRRRARRSPTPRWTASTAPPTRR